MKPRRTLTWVRFRLTWKRNVTGPTEHLRASPKASRAAECGDPHSGHRMIRCFFTRFLRGTGSGA
jgi:hypothetical protein